MGKCLRGRPKTKFSDIIKEDMKVVRAWEEEVWDRTVWRRRCMSAVAIP